MTARTFGSAKQALSYALSVRQHTAGPVSRGEGRGGTPPDYGLVSSIFACVQLGGVDPHADEDVTTASLWRWATCTDGADEAVETSARLGEAVRRIAANLRQFGIVTSPEALPEVGRRAIELDGRVCWVACSEPVADAPPVEARTVTPDREALLARDVAKGIERIKAGEAAGAVDLEIAQRWGCSTTTVTRRRAAQGHRAKRGRRVRWAPASGTVPE